MQSEFTGELKQLIDRAIQGSPADVDFIMDRLSDHVTFAMTRYIDFALSLIERSEGIERIEFYLFNGSLINRIPRGSASG